MDLKDFVRETLLQISTGIKEAQMESSEIGAVVNPGLYDSEADYNYAVINNKKYPIQEVDFEVALTSTSEEGNKKGIGVLLGSFSIGGNKDNRENNTALTSIKFTIPIVFPVIDGNNQITDQIIAINPGRRDNHY